MANIITFVRIICSIALLFFPAFSPAFYALYLIAGFSDMIDGTVARKTGTVSEFGSKLDTAADIVFAAACLIKLLPVLRLLSWSFIWIGIIAMIKVVNIAYGFKLQGKFVAVHSVMNKVTGLLLFVLPLSVTFIDLRYSAVIVCAAATFAAIQEGHYIRTGMVGRSIS
jgi:CDP-diacylglycerol--glycerol-3-phosphate 3-phosphatidyltransferase